MKAMSQRAYKAHGGLKCPVCRSTNISTGETDFVATGATAYIECIDCGQSWTKKLQADRLSARRTRRSLPDLSRNAHLLGLRAQHLSFTAVKTPTAHLTTT